MPVTQGGGSFTVDLFNTVGGGGGGGGGLSPMMIFIDHTHSMKYR